MERQPRVAIKDMMSGTQGGGGERAPRDFVTENAIAAILAAPRAKGKPEEKNWLAAPGFAKRPAYLERIKAQLAAEREYVLELADAQLKSSARSHGGAMREMGDEERAELLGQLKAKWSEVNAVRRWARFGAWGTDVFLFWGFSSLTFPPTHTHTFPLSPAPAALQRVCSQEDFHHQQLSG